MVRWLGHLLLKHLNPHTHIKKVGMALHIPVNPGLWGAETGGLQRLLAAGKVSGESQQKRPLPEGRHENLEI